MLRVAPLSGEAKPKRKVSHVREGLAVSANLGFKACYRFNTLASAYRAASTSRKDKALSTLLTHTSPALHNSSNLRSGWTKVSGTQDHVDVHGRRRGSRNFACYDLIRTSGESSSCRPVFVPLVTNWSGVTSTNYLQEYRGFGLRVALGFQVHQYLPLVTSVTV